MCCTAGVGKAVEPPKWIKPQLTRVIDEAPAGDDWLHEIKYDGYRMHARLDRGKIQLLTRTVRSLPAKTAYLDGELCALRPDGVPAFAACRPRWMRVAPMTCYSSSSTGTEQATRVTA